MLYEILLCRNLTVICNTLPCHHLLCGHHFPQSHLLSSGVQAKQADKATDLQQEINKNSQASKEGECPHGRHVGQGSYKDTVNNFNSM